MAPTKWGDCGGIGKIGYNVITGRGRNSQCCPTEWDYISLLVLVESSDYFTDLALFDADDASLASFISAQPYSLYLRVVQMISNATDLYPPGRANPAVWLSSIAATEFNFATTGAFWTAPPTEYQMQSEYMDRSEYSFAGIRYAGKTDDNWFSPFDPSVWSTNPTVHSPRLIPRLDHILYCENGNFEKADMEPTLTAFKAWRNSKPLLSPYTLSETQINHTDWLRAIEECLSAL